MVRRRKVENTIYETLCAKKTRRAMTMSRPFTYTPITVKAPIVYFKALHHQFWKLFKIYNYAMRYTCNEIVQLPSAQIYGLLFARLRLNLWYTIALQSSKSKRRPWRCRRRIRIRAMCALSQTLTFSRKQSKQLYVHGAHRKLWFMLYVLSAYRPREDCMPRFASFSQQDLDEPIRIPLRRPGSTVPGLIYKYFLNVVYVFRSLRDYLRFIWCSVNSNKPTYSTNIFLPSEKCFYSRILKKNTRSYPNRLI